MENKNSEGYLDLTAAMAIRNVEEQYMGDAHMGEVYFNERSNPDVEGVRNGILVLSTQKYFATVINISNGYCDTGHDFFVPIHIDKIGTMTARCREINTISKGFLETYVTRVSKSEMENIENAVLKYLGLRSGGGENTEVLMNLHMLKGQVAAYKEMYEDLWKKAVGNVIG